MLYAVIREYGWCDNVWLDSMLEDVDIVITGNRDFQDYNTDNEQWDRLFGSGTWGYDKKIDELVEDYLDDETGGCLVSKMLEEEFPKPNGEQWTQTEIKRFEKAYEDYVYSFTDEDGRCELLNLLVGGNWKYEIGRGYSQGEWNVFYYNTEEKNGFRVTKEYIETVINEYFGMYGEWLVGESKEKEYSPTEYNINILDFILNECDCYTEHTYGDYKNAKEELAQASGVSPEEIVIIEPYKVTAYKMM